MTVPSSDHAPPEDSESWTETGQPEDPVAPQWEAPANPGPRGAVQSDPEAPAPAPSSDPAPTPAAPSTDGSTTTVTATTGTGAAAAGATAAGPPTTARPGGVKRVLEFFKELPGLLLLAFILALLIKTFVIQAFYIPSGSMEHTLDIGDRVLVNKVVYHIHPPRRGDIIVFSDPHPVPQPPRNIVSAVVHWLTDGLGISRDPNKDFIKRVIGLPGETVEMKGGKVFVDGKRLPEGYLGPAASLGDFPPTTVAHDRLFVMGDNRGDSNDSRGTLGQIPEDKVIGRAFVIIWPPSRIGLLRRPDYGTKFAALAAVIVPAWGGAVLGRRRRRRRLAAAS